MHPDHSVGQGFQSELKSLAVAAFPLIRKNTFSTELAFEQRGRNLILSRILKVVSKSAL